MDELTDDERAAIKALRRLAKKWPRTLLVFGGAQSGLSIRKPVNGSYGISTEVAMIDGIPCDGGDGGDDF